MRSGRAAAKKKDPPQEKKKANKISAPLQIEDFGFCILDFRFKF